MANSFNDCHVVIINQTNKQQLTLEQAQELVGSNGFYQFRLLLIFLFQWMVSVFVFIGPIYFLSNPSFICGNGEKCTEDTGGCINQILYPTEYRTMTTDFKIYCNQRYFRDLCSSMLYFGPVFGIFILTYISDIYGRRTALLISWAISTIGILGVTCSYNKYMLIISLFTAGFGLVPCNSLNFIILNEQSGNSFRQQSSTTLLFSWPIFSILLTGVAYYIYNWRLIYIIFISIPSILIIILNFYVRESPQYLQFKKQTFLIQELNYIARINNKEQISQESKQIENAFSQEQYNSLRKHTHIDLVKFSSLRYITLASCYTMFTTQLLYYSTQFSLSGIGNNIYINSILITSGEALAYIIFNRIIEKIKRKKFCILFLTLSILFSISFIAIPDKWSDLQITIAILVRLTNGLTSGILSVYVEELYPFVVRSLGTGAQMGIGLIGSSLAPILCDQAKQIGLQPLFFIGIINIPAIFVSIFFKETYNKKLQYDLQEFLEKQETFTN